MPHEVDDFAAQGTPDTLSITSDEFACILSSWLTVIVYSGGFIFLKGPRDEIKWAQLGHCTRESIEEMPGTLAIADDGFACIPS